MASDVGNLRFAFFGTPKVASDTLAMLILRGFIPTIIVTSPDAPKGRGLALAPSEAKTLALAHNLKVITPETFDEKTIANVSTFGCDYAVVVAYGKIFPEALINAFPRGVLNVHYSLLPKYRGATPVETVLLAGDTETGVSIQKMAKKLDAGDIVARKVVEIKDGEGACELRPRLIAIGANLLIDILPDYLEGKITPAPQDHTRATFTKKITKEDGLIDLTEDPLENYKKIRALNDGSGAYFFTSRNGRRLRVRIVEASYKSGVLTIVRVVPEGRKEMSYEDFLRGENFHLLDRANSLGS